MPGRSRSLTFVNHDGNGIATGTNTLARAESHDGYHRVIATNHVVSRRRYELEIGEAERICRMDVVGKFCWTWRWRRHSRVCKRTGYCQPDSIAVVLQPAWVDDHVWHVVRLRLSHVVVWCMGTVGWGGYRCGEVIMRCWML
jgi:hypothetical protein